jgi:4-diphosphocytidyl-2-C-methyl-D-erythritol kinase
MTSPSHKDTASYLCYAKINLILRVLRKRPDGYHDIDSLMCTVDLADTVTIDWADSGVEVECSVPGLSGRANLAWAAATRFFEVTGMDGGARISISKRIPISAGLGGGSTDAACVLNALARRYGLGDLAPGGAARPGAGGPGAAGSGSPGGPGGAASGGDPAGGPAGAPAEDSLARLALEVGSDVPYLLRGGLARVRGRGEIVEPVEAVRAPAARSLDLVTATPSIEVSSFWAYGQLGMGLTGAGGRDSITWLDAALADRSSLAGALENDLESAVFTVHPAVASLKARMAELGALGAVMSGSGPTVLAIVEDRAQAEKMAERLGAEGHAAFALRTTDSALSAR